MGAGSYLQYVNWASSLWGQPLQSRSENMVEVSSLSSSKRRGSGRELGFVLLLWVHPLSGVGMWVVTSVHWWVVIQWGPLQVPLVLQTRSLPCLEQNDGLCQGQPAGGRLAVCPAGLDGGHLTVCQEESMSHNSNEFCAFLGGKLFNITKHEFFWMYPWAMNEFWAYTISKMKYHLETFWRKCGKTTLI